MKRLMCFLVMIFSATKLYAQGTETYNTNVQVHSGLFYFNSMAVPFSHQNGLSVSRKVYNNIWAGAAFTFWNKDLREANNRLEEPPEWMGDLFAKLRYRFVDVYGGYTLNLRRHLRVYGNVGVSYVTGENWFIDDVWEIPGYHWNFSLGTRRVNYIGPIATIGYDHLFFKKHINLGVSGKVRYYGSEYQQYEVNLNVGYNFNLFKPKATTEE